MAYPNLAPWSGVPTMTEPQLYCGPHLKSPFRPNINGTRTAELALEKDQVKRRRQYLSLGERIREVYHSYLQFDQHEADWQYRRMLGCGTFGFASLYQRREGLLLKDELVAKSEMPDKNLAMHPTRIDVATEVWHMAQLAERHGDAKYGVVKLRGYRYITGDRSTQTDEKVIFQRTADHTEKPLYREWRTFMENCSYGTLTRLMMTYRAWGYYIPEAFIWWTFKWLIDGCRVMEPDPGAHFYNARQSEIARWPGSFMLANDIKDENVFYGYPRPGWAPGAPFDQYPAPRLGDFGLSQIVTMNADNRRDKLYTGTRIWSAPEKRDMPMGQNEAGDPSYLFYQPQRVDTESWIKDQGVPANTAAHCLGPEANTWTVGVIIFLLMTLDDQHDIDTRVDKMLQDVSKRDDPKIPHYLLEAHDFDRHLEVEEDYSDALKALVQNCTRLEPLKRPSTNYLMREINQGIMNERKRLEHEFGDEDSIRAATRMAFANEEWLSVPQGPFSLMDMPIPGNTDDKKNLQAWESFQGRVMTWADPDAPTLVPPGRYKTVSQARVPCKLPFVGTDGVYYAEVQPMAHYHRGPPLPRGGRARGKSLHDSSDVLMDFY